MSLLGCRELPGERVGVLAPFLCRPGYCRALRLGRPGWDVGYNSSLLPRATFSAILAVVKRLPEHVQVDDPAAQRKLAKKLERQQVGGGLGSRRRAAGLFCLRPVCWASGSGRVGSRICPLLGTGNL